jgi:hypothetical protein
MDKDELQAALAGVGWTYSTLAGFLDCSERTVRQMAHGERNIPDPIARWLNALLRWHESHPAPDDWRTFPGLIAPPKQRTKAEKGK